MSLRKQKTGSQKPWSQEELEAGLTHFYTEHNRYPTSEEVNEYIYLPSARSIQRSHGGLVQLRQALGLQSQNDFRSGEHSSRRAHKINKRAHTIEHRVYTILIEKFGEEFVHREFFFTDDKRMRTDFFIYTQKGNFAVDVFYPSTTHSMVGCINSKLRNYKNTQLNYPVIFLMANDSIAQEEIDSFIERKKEKLGTQQKIMTHETFTRFLTTQERRV